MTDETRVLEGGAVVTVDADRRVLDPGAVVVEGGRVRAVDDRASVREAHPDADRIELHEHVLLPGLVDTHGHAGHGLTKNLAADEGRWLDAVRALYFEHAGESFWAAESRLAALERLRAGVTTSLSYVGSEPRVDHPRYAEAAAAGYDAFGLRHVVAVGPPDPPYPRRFADPERDEGHLVDLDGALETTGRVADSLDGAAGGRLRVAVAPASLAPELDGGEATPRAAEAMRRVAALAEEYDLPVQAHAYGGHVAAAAGAAPELLSERLSLAHCAGVSTRELDLMAEHGVSASHGPLTNAYARDRFPVVEAMERGVTVAVSTDGAAPDRSFDLLAQPRVAMKLQQAYFGDTSLLPAGRLLESITVDAASALGLDGEVGALAPGTRADVIALDRRSPRLAPARAPVHRAVHYANGDDVSFVMVDGDVLLRDGAVRVGPDAETVLADAESEMAAAAERAGETDALDPDPAWGAIRYDW
jgi:cytosine/adenosine deaminase-related metal-dependent hydrolase